MAVLQKGKKEPRNEGPYVKNLDRMLATFNVCRQTYYSGTFVGNHIHTEGRVITFLLLCRTFESYLDFFVQCHSVYDSSKLPTVTDIEELRKYKHRFHN